MNEAANKQTGEQGARARDTGACITLSQGVGRQDLVESCNAMAVGLKGTAQRLEQEGRCCWRGSRSSGSAEQHNVARREAQTKHEHDGRLRANKGDAEHWLTGARAFRLDGFKTRSEGGIRACEAARVTEVATLPHDQAVGRAQACLKALLAK